MEFNLPKKRELLTVENVFNLVTELEIYRHFIGHEFVVGKVFLSPLRPEKKPSFGIYPTLGSKYKYHCKDFKGFNGNIMSFICELYKKEFNLLFALYTINKEMHLGLDDISVSKSLKLSKVSNSETIIKYNNYQKQITASEVEFRIVKRDFQKYDKDFWSGGCIQKSTLDFFHVYATEEVWMNKGEGWTKIWINSKLSPIYSYYFSNTNHFKHYRPFEKVNAQGDIWKWLSNCNIDDIQGYHQLPLKGNTLILTKSLKDVMTLYELGFNAISFHAEGVNVPEERMKELLSRFTNVICYYDNDEAGKLNSHKITKGYNIRHFNNPDGLIEKDAFDYVKSFGQKAMLELLAKKNIFPDYDKIRR